MWTGFGESSSARQKDCTSRLASDARYTPTSHASGTARSSASLSPRWRKKKAESRVNGLSAFARASAAVAQPLMEVQAAVHSEYGAQSVLPLPQLLSGVFQNLMRFR